MSHHLNDHIRTHICQSCSNSSDLNFKKIQDNWFRYLLLFLDFYWMVERNLDLITYQALYFFLLLCKSEKNKYFQTTYSTEGVRWRFMIFWKFIYIFHKNKFILTLREIHFAFRRNPSLWTEISSIRAYDVSFKLKV